MYRYKNHVCGWLDTKGKWNQRLTLLQRIKRGIGTGISVTERARFSGKATTDVANLYSGFPSFASKGDKVAYVIERWRSGKGAMNYERDTTTTTRATCKQTNECKHTKAVRTYTWKKRCIYFLDSSHKIL